MRSGIVKDEQKGDLPPSAGGIVFSVAVGVGLASVVDAGPVLGSGVAAALGMV